MSIRSHLRNGFTIEPPEWAVQEGSPPSSGPLPRTIDGHDVFPGDIIESFRTLKAKPYPRNRSAKQKVTGSGIRTTAPGIAVDIVERVATKYNPHCIDVLKFAVIDGVLMLGSGHNRVQAMMYRWDMGWFTKKELETTIRMEVVPADRFLDVVVECNKHKEPRAKDFVSNRDYTYGRISANKVYPHMNDAAKQHVLDLKIQHVHATVLYYLHKDWRNDGEHWVIENLFCDSEEAKKYWDSPAGTLTISDQDGEDLASAFERLFWIYESTLKNTFNNEQYKDLKFLMRTSFWTWFYVINRLSDDDTLPSDERLVSALLNNSSALRRNIPSHDGWRPKDLSAGIDKFLTILNRKHKKAA
jgi:hypothetical protein